jgi:hypothetical protein
LSCLLEVLPKARHAHPAASERATPARGQRSPGRSSQTALMDGISKSATACRGQPVFANRNQMLNASRPARARRTLPSSLPLFQAAGTRRADDALQVLATGGFCASRRLFLSSSIDNLCHAPSSEATCLGGSVSIRHLL